MNTLAAVAADVAPREDDKECLVCGKRMPTIGIKCTECESFQDWRRHLPLSDTVLSLLVALVAVIGAVGPKILDIANPNSKTRVQIIDGRDEDLFVSVWNEGRRPSVLRRVEVEFRGLPLRRATLTLRQKDQAYLAPGESDLIALRATLYPDGVSRDQMLAGIDRGRVIVTAHVEESDDDADDMTEVQDAIPASFLRNWITARAITTN